MKILTCVALFSLVSHTVMLFRHFSAADVISHDRRDEFSTATLSSRTRELVRSRTSTTKSGEIKSILNSADLLDTSSFQQTIDTGNNSSKNGKWARTETWETAKRIQITTNPCSLHKILLIFLVSTAQNGLIAPTMAPGQAMVSMRACRARLPQLMGHHNNGNRSRLP